MNKKFKDLKIGDKLYFVTSTSEGVSLTESIVEDVVFNKYISQIEIVNDFCNVVLHVEDYIYANSKSIKTFEKNIAVFVEQKVADECYGDFVKKSRKKEEPSFVDTLLFTKKELDKMSFEELRNAFDQMSFEEKLYHGLETLKEFNLFDFNIEDEDEDEENSYECKCNKCNNCTCDTNSLQSEDYDVPSYDEIRKIGMPNNLNENGGLKSEQALLVITVNENGILELDENHFDGVNPLYNGPKYYFHAIKVPAFDAAADECSVDEVYRAIEDWIYKTYPEFEHLSYGEDWEYNILRGQDYTVDNTELNFNVFE